MTVYVGIPQPLRSMTRTLGGSFLLLLAFGTVVNAAPPHTFVPGETLAAGSLNQNFTNIDTRLTNLEAPITVVEAISNANETGTLSVPYVYTAATITLTPGTWLIEAQATLYTMVNADGIQLDLYNATTGQPVAGSRSGVGETRVVGGAVMLSTSKLLTVTANTDIRMRGDQNGTSVVNFGYLGGGLSEGNRLFAVKLR